jgi:AsmA protein
MRRFVRIAAAALGLLVLLAIAVPFMVDANAFRPMLESQLGDALGRPVKLGDLRLKLLSGAVEAGDLSIAEDPEFRKQIVGIKPPDPWLEARSVQIGVELMPLLFSRKLNVTRIVIEEPRVTLIQSPAGAWNFSSLGGRAVSAPKPDPAPSGQPLDLSVKLVKIENGRFAFGRVILEKVDVELRDFSAATASPFSFRATVAGGGEIELDGTAGPIDSGNTIRTPATATLKISGLDLATPGWAPGGLATLDGSLQSNGKTAAVKGKLRADKLKLTDRGTPATRPVELDFAAEHRLSDGSGRVTRGDVSIGAAVVHLTGGYTTLGDEAALRMALTGDAMPVPELAAVLPALGIVLPAGASFQSGTAAVKLAAEGPVSRLVTTGTVALDNATLGGFDLGRKMAVLQALTGIKGTPSTQIQTLSSSIRMSPDGTAAESLQLVVASIGELTGGGTISPANALDFRMTAKVAGTPIPFFVQGTSADPVIRPDVKGVFTEKAKGIAGSLKGIFGRKKD